MKKANCSHATVASRRLDARSSMSSTSSTSLARRTFKHVMVPKVLVSLHKQNVQSLNQQSGTRQWAACEAHTGCVCAVMLLASRVGRVGTVHDGSGHVAGTILTGPRGFWISTQKTSC